MVPPTTHRGCVQLNTTIMLEGKLSDSSIEADREDPIKFIDEDNFLEELFLGMTRQFFLALPLLNPLALPLLSVSPAQKSLTIQTCMPPPLCD